MTAKQPGSLAGAVIAVIAARRAQVFRTRLYRFHQVSKRAPIARFNLTRDVLADARAARRFPVLL